MPDRPAVFLDRDGVLNRVRMDGAAARTPLDTGDLVVEAGVRPVLERLRAAGYLLLVVSNQPDIARGIITRESVERIHARLCELLPLDGVYYCPHVDADGCECRKPKPGLLLRAAEEHGVALARSWLIGDRWADVGAAAAAGVTGILLETGYSWRATHSGSPPPDLVPAYRGPDLAACAEHILGSSRP